MKAIEARLAVFAALLALAGPAMSHGCEDHLPLIAAALIGALEELRPPDWPATPGPLNC